MKITKKVLSLMLAFIILSMSVFNVFAADTAVNPTASKVIVNGIEKSFEAYNIKGYDYFKLRDIAFVLNSTNKQFSVGYDENTKAITMSVGQTYIPTGGEMVMGDGQTKLATATVSKIYLDGTELNFTVYNIAGNNFFKLVDIMSALNVGVTYDVSTKNIGIDTSVGFVGVVAQMGADATSNDGNPSGVESQDIDTDSYAPWSADVVNPKHDSSATEIFNGFAFEFEYRSEIENFVISDYLGDYTAIDSIRVSNESIGFSIFQNIISYGDFFMDFANGVNINYGERIADNTAERREALSKVLRIYINGDLVSGELSRTQGNGHVDYSFNFDNRFSLNDIKTMRLELGYNQEQTNTTTTMNLHVEAREGTYSGDGLILFEIINEDDRQKIIDIIMSSMQSPLSGEAVRNYELTSARFPYRFHADNGTIYWFERQGNLLIIYNNGYESAPQYYYASDFDSVMEIHSEYTE